MDTSQRSRLAVGLILVVLGVAFLALQFSPNLGQWFQVTVSWPLIVIGVGLMILVIGLLTASPDTANGACVVAGIGGILYYQNLSGNWVSWSYAWALIPGFSGVGMIIAGLLGSKTTRPISRGLNQIITSVILFLIFGSIFGPMFGGFSFLGPYWPLLLVGAGLLIILRSLVRRW
jgi:hypothetical protein